MVPIFKVVSLVIRLFTKPFSSYLKQSLKLGNVKNTYLQTFIIYLGQKYHVINIRITRRLSNVGGDFYIKPLTEEKALDSGADFIGEIIAYGTLFFWGIYEVNKLSKDTKKKEKALNDTIAGLHAEIQGVQSHYKAMMDEIEKIKENAEKNQTKEETQAEYKQEG